MKVTVMVKKSLRLILSNKERERKQREIFEEMEEIVVVKKSLSLCL